MWRSRCRCVIKPAYSFSFLLSINIFVWQNVLYFLDAPRMTLTIKYSRPIEVFGSLYPATCGLTEDSGQNCVLRKMHSLVPRFSDENYQITSDDLQHETTHMLLSFAAHRFPKYKTVFDTSR